MDDANSDGSPEDEPGYGMFYFDANCQCGKKDCFVCNQKQMPKDFEKIVDKHFWDLV